MKQYSINEQKLVYRALHKQLTEMPELMDSELLQDLQNALQRQAQADGIDVADHGAWDAWLGNQPVSCEERMTKRRVLS